MRNNLSYPLWLLPAIFVSVLLLVLVESIPNSKLDYTAYDESDPEHWRLMARHDIRERLNVFKPINRRAKNVILFLGDGMGVSTITAARILNGQLKGKNGEEGFLEFDKFPNSALIKTYNLNKQVPDSAGTATAYLTGVKANFYTLGVSGRVYQNTTDCQLIKQNSVPSVLHWALDAKKWAGIVTTTRVTHATPAAGYSHIQDRDLEGHFPPERTTGAGGCKDIARQLIEDYPGVGLNVVLGGGREKFTPNSEQDSKGTLRMGKIEPVSGNRTDGRNLIKEWLNKRKQMGLAEKEFAYVNSTGSLRKRMKHSNKLKYLFGLFNHTNMEYEALRDKSGNGEPSLTEMTEAAIKVLSNSDNGFVLLVEGGRIDHAHHDGFAKMALLETVEFNRAIERARQLVSFEDTLIVVTADHSHTMTINGYPNRGNPIAGIAFNDTDQVPFQTLMYTNGPGHKSFEQRKNILNESYRGDKYRPHSAVHLVQSNHGGEDVALFATGPMAHLFGGTHEQSYIAHVMAYASCIDVYTDSDHCQDSNNKIPESQRQIFGLRKSTSSAMNLVPASLPLITTITVALCFAVVVDRIFPLF